MSNFFDKMEEVLGRCDLVESNLREAGFDGSAEEFNDEVTSPLVDLYLAEKEDVFDEEDEEEDDDMVEADYDDYDDFDDDDDYYDMIEAESDDDEEDDEDYDDDDEEDDEDYDDEDYEDDEDYDDDDYEEAAAAKRMKPSAFKGKKGKRKKWLCCTRVVKGRNRKGKPGFKTLCRYLLNGKKLVRPKWIKAPTAKFVTQNGSYTNKPYSIDRKTKKKIQNKPVRPPKAMYVTPQGGLTHIAKNLRTKIANKKLADCKDMTKKPGSTSGKPGKQKFIGPKQMSERGQAINRGRDFAKRARENEERERKIARSRQKAQHTRLSKEYSENARKKS